MTDRTVVYRLRAELSQFKAQMAQASAASRKVATDLTAIDKQGATTRRGLDTLGSTAGKVGLVAAAGFGAAVVTAANFDKAMSNVQAATHESTQNMEDLREAAIQAGQDTAFSASEAAAGIENLAKAGVSTTDILDGGLTGALDLAAAGGLDVGAAAEQAATAMTQFGLAGKDVPHIADLLAAGAGKAQGEVTDLGMALNQSGLVAAQMGLSIEETTGGLAAFASAGLLGSDAGTSLKTMLLRLANPSQKAADTMADLGITAYDAQGNFVGLESLAGQLQGAFEGQTQAQRDAALATIFGSDAIRAANVLYTQGATGIADWTGKVDDSGYAAETAATKLDNLSGDLEAFRGSLETALIGTGEGSQGPLRSLVQGATSVVNAFNKMPDSAQGVVGSLLAITAVTGGSLWFATKVVSGVANAKSALSDLGIEAGRTKGALANIGRGAAGLTAIIATADLAQAAITKLADTSIETGTLNRDLEALADGRITDNLDNLFHSFQDIDNGWQTKANPISWISSWDPSGFEDARDNFAAIDESLASMVESGNGETAAAAFEQLAAKGEEAGTSLEETKALFPEYATALDNAATSTEDATGATGELTTSQTQATKSLARMEAAAEKQAKALKASRDAAHGTAEEFFNLGDNLDNAKVSLGEWLRDLEKQAAALRDFRLNAEKAAKKGLDEGLIASLEAAGPAGALRMKQLADATDAEIDRANRAWRRGQAEIDRYTDAVGGVPESVATDVTVHAESAMQKLYELDRIKLDDKTIYVHTVAVGSGEVDAVSGGQRRAMGGYISGPGTATSDSIPARLSDGEYVVKASAVDKYGVAFFDNVNAMRFASGGHVGGAASSGSPLSLSGMRVTGTLDTAWGPARIEGIVDDRIAAHATYAGATGPRRRGGPRD